MQNRLSSDVIRSGIPGVPRSIAGIDVSITRYSKTGRAAIVVIRWPDLEVDDVSVVEGPVAFPYIPGLLSFREAPLIIKAWAQLSAKPDMIMADGQGIAHPRRIGLASHLGLVLDVTSIGCAKSRLIGTYDEPADEHGSYSLLLDNNEVIGAALRTRSSVKPIFVSIGHKIDLPNSIRWIMNCCRGLRLPEPTRLAHLAAAGNLSRTRRGAATAK